MKKGGDQKPGNLGKKASITVATSEKLRLSPAGSKIVLAFEEAIEAVRGGGLADGRLTMRNYHVDFDRPEYGPTDVRRVRDLLGMSQVVFARFLGVGPSTIRSWEQGSRPPGAIARRFMGEIEHDPDYWRNRLSEGRAEG